VSKSVTSESVMLCKWRYFLKIYLNDVYFNIRFSELWTNYWI